MTDIGIFISGFGFGVSLMMTIDLIFRKQWDILYWVPPVGLILTSCLVLLYK